MAYVQNGVSFNGRRIIHPGAYDYIDGDSMVASTPGSLNIPIVVGEADSGETGKILWFSDPTLAKKYLKGGSLANAMDLMFSPVPEGGGGCSLVGVMVTNATVKATLNAGGITHTAKEFGDYGNKVQVKVQAGTIANTKKYTAYRWDTDTLEVFDNLGAIMKIQYLGTAAYADITVTVTSGSATTIQTKTGATSGTAVVDLTLDLTSGRYKTVEDVVRYISSVSNYGVSYVNYDNAQMDITKLDAVSALSITGGAYLTSVKGDMEYQINNGSDLVDVAVTGAIADVPYTYLAGGSKGVSPASWATYLDNIKKQFSDVLVILSSSTAIHAEALAHIQQMELRGQKQMLFTGGDVGETVDRVKQRAAMLNSSRAVIAYPDIYHKSISDGKVIQPAYMTAAMLAGRVCGVDATEPITFDMFNVVSLGNNLVTGDPSIDDLMLSGVSCLEVVQNGGIRLAHAVTTYLGTDNPLYKEISVRRGADKVSSRVTQALEAKFVGKKGVKATTSPTNSSVVTATIDELEQAIKDEDLNGYRNIVVRRSGTAIYVEYEAAIVEPINYVLVTSHFVSEDI